ncbi:maleylpyruvate isomerase family mycothiol-dependent enzyme [Microlunatus spumicola]|uniref:Maleylpyruvate isomerase family mycothiol-dependent enzyme n=1 Tax=Microlunatus spumicola TaxID=81499 RepID=A0ABP6WIF1_9ACTN
MSTTGSGSGPDPVDHLAALRTEGDLLVAAVRGADLDATVPGLTWDVRTVAVHTGSVHRWATDLVRRRLPAPTGSSAAFTPADLPDDDLAAWLTDGLDALVTTLRDAPADLACFTFVDGIAPRTFWRRRQAHETAVHRADVEAAGGADVTPVPAAFAQDGLAELVGAFATEAAYAVDRRGLLALVPDDGPAWSVRFGDGPHRVTTGPAVDVNAADAVVRGSGSAVYLWAWNRPSPVEVTGDDAVLALWRRVRVT